MESFPLKSTVSGNDSLLRARESINIWKYENDKRMGVEDIEHGPNLNLGQL